MTELGYHRSLPRNASQSFSKKSVKDGSRHGLPTRWHTIEALLADDLTLLGWNKFSDEPRRLVEDGEGEKCDIEPAMPLLVYV
jgi:hypothetical protein